MNNTPRRVVLKPRIAIFAYLKNLKAPIQTHFLKHYPKSPKNYKFIGNIHFMRHQTPLSKQTNSPSIQLIDGELVVVPCLK